MCTMKHKMRIIKITTECNVAKISDHRGHLIQRQCQNFEGKLGNSSFGACALQLCPKTLIISYVLCHDVTFREIHGRKGARFFLHRENAKKQCNFNTNLNLNPNFQGRLIRQIGVVLSNGTLWSNKSGSTQRNAHWLSTKCVLASDQSAVMSSFIQPNQGVVVCGRAVCRAEVVWLYISQVTR